MRSSNILRFVNLLLLLACIAATGCTQTEIRREVSETLITEVPYPLLKRAVYFPVSPDGRHIAYVCSAGDKKFAVIDMQKHREYDKVGFPIFSPDSKRVAYLAKKGGKWFVVLDGKELTPYDCIEQLLFSPDSERFAYAVGTKRKDLEDEVPERTASWDGLSDEYFDWSVVIDGKEQKQYGLVYDLSFSANSRRFAYTATVGQRGEDPGCRPWESSEDFVVIDGEEQKRWDSVCRFTFSPNSEHYAYFVEKVYEEQDERWLNIRKWRVVYDNAESKEYEDLGKAPEFSPDGNHLAYKVKLKWEEFIVLDGKEQKKYKSVSSLLLPNVIFSPNGQHYAYSAYLGKNRTVLVLDGREIEVNCNPMNLVLSPDGRPYAFRGYKGGEYVMVFNGKEQPGRQASNPIFSPDGRRFAYRAGPIGDPPEAGMFVVVDGEIYKKYYGVGPPLFSPDSRHIVYKAGRMNEWFIVVDGNEGKRYDIILTETIFDSDNSFHYLAVKDNKVYLVEEKLK